LSFSWVWGEPPPSVQGPGGQEKLRDWFPGFAVLCEPCELGPRLEGGFADRGDSAVFEIIISKNWGNSCEDYPPRIPTVA
jgi:hypothetical protein